ncbi:MAG: metallopeptidase TldD-related protein [Nitrospirae bacterium]|nr:metallopeptidase TldD-related protein [Nitrospirota bacterium]MCL5285488.1 metallopeptidase TldD-related protein [Nitrospirota bacterium]
MSTAIRDFDSGQEAVAHILEAAKRAGATSADALYVWTDEENVTVRKGALEKIQASQSQGLGIRVFVGQAQSSISTRDLSRQHIDELVARAVAMARHTAADPYAGLPEELSPPAADPEILFPPETEVPTREELFDRARIAEEAALSHDPRITNSEGADCARSQARIVFGNTLGFLGGYRKSSYSLSCSVIATEGDSMERDYWYVAGPLWEVTKDPGAVGTKAARRTVSRLHARRVPTGSYPVLFDPETARSLIGHFAGAISGSALYRNATYLKDREGTAVMSEKVTLREDPFIPGGLGSRPFDGEGLPTRKKTLVDRGILTTYLFDTYSARKMRRHSTGNAVRSLGDGPGVGVTNLVVAPGPRSLDELVSGLSEGLLVTELIGFGVNTVTGDYSRGAFGYWIKNGTILHPVSEITIAGTLDDLYRGIVEVGSDLEIRSSVNTPSLLVEGLRIAGE